MSASDRPAAPRYAADQIASLLASLSRPLPTSIECLAVTAEYHAIYILRFPPEAAEQLLPARTREADGSMALVLRVSLDSLPGIKTLNEVAVMRWVAANTTVPVPAVVAYDATSDNVLGREYTLLEKAAGVSTERVIGTFDEGKRRRFVEQLVDITVQLHAKGWDHIGGLALDENGKPAPGPVLEETFWQLPDIATYWSSTALKDGSQGQGMGTIETVETVETLNIRGPYPSYAAYLAAHTERYIYAIRRHPTLSWLRDLIPRLQTFISAISDGYTAEINATKLLLAHKDLHLANIMCDPATATVTAVLDWEFSGVVPAPRWDPVAAFLWTGRRDAAAKATQEALRGLFEEVCREKGSNVLEEVKATAMQVDAQRVVNHLRALVEVGPRGQAADKVTSWRDVVDAGLVKFGCE